MASTVAYYKTAVIAVVKCLVGLGRKEGKKNVVTDGFTDEQNPFEKF
jgi:hypothetical protein